MVRAVKNRESTGGAMIGLVLTLFLLIAYCGFFAFDASRAQMCQRQLVALADAAALAGTSMLSSYDLSDDDTNLDKLTTAQNNSIQYAQDMVLQGNVLGTPLSTGSINGSRTLKSVSILAAGATESTLMSTTPGKLNILVQCCNPSNSYGYVAVGTYTGTAISVQLAYGYKPPFLGSVLKVGNYALRAGSTSGLPQVDTVMVFDYSGSMDDMTCVAIVERMSTQEAAYTNIGKAEYDYNSTNTATNSSTPDGWCERLTDYVGWDYNTVPAGSQTNVLPPQHLTEIGAVTYSGTTTNNMPGTLGPNNCVPTGEVPTGVFSSGLGTTKHFAFDAYVRNHWTETQDFGNAPGNYYGYEDGSIDNVAAGGVAYFPIPYSPPYVSGVYGFTDIVVAIDDPNNTACNSNSPSSVPPYQQPLYASYISAGATVPYSGSFSGFTTTFPSSSSTYQILDASTGTYNSLAYEPDSVLQGQTYGFPSLNYVIEASRGNLDTNGYFQGALLGGISSYQVGNEGWTAFALTDVSGTTNGPHTYGTYQRAYQRLAMLFSQPIATAVDGAYRGFFQKINTLADCRFGFVAFSDSSGFSGGGELAKEASQVYSDYFVYNPGSTEKYDYSWLSFDTNRIGEYIYNTNTTIPSHWTGGNTKFNTAGFILPRYYLNAGDTQNAAFLGVTDSGNWSDQNSTATGLFNCYPLTTTTCGEALNTAVGEFADSHYNYASSGFARATAKRAVIFFTDGEPTDSQSISTSAATVANGYGIAIYPIGLALNSSILSSQSAFLGNTSAGGGGLAYLAGNGSQFFQCTQSSDIMSAFSAVVRRLTEDVQ